MICGIIGYVKDGWFLKIEGNLNDFNSCGYFCVCGYVGLNYFYYLEWLLYLFKCVGVWGEGKWKWIFWDEVFDEIVDWLRKVCESGKFEEFVFY